MNKFRSIKNKNYEHLKKPKPGEILLVPQHPSLMEERGRPYPNTVSNTPNWFRSIGKYAGSIRGCAGTQDFLTVGITVPMWTNAIFSPDPSTERQWNVNLDQIRLGNKGEEIFDVQSFGFGQTGACPMTEVRKIEDSCYPKIINPWSFITAPGWSTLVLPVLFEPNLDYDVVPAVVHTDFYHVMHLVLNIKTDKEFTIKYGTPVFHLIPFERKHGTPAVKFEDSSWTPFVASRGFNAGPTFPSGSSTATPYRQNRRIIDKEIEQQSLNKKGIRKLWNR